MLTLLFTAIFVYFLRQAKTDINLSDISSPEVSEASSSEDEDDKSDSTHALPPSSTPVMPVHPAVPSPAPAPTSSQMPPPSLPHVRHASGSGRGGTAPPSANAGPPTTTRPGSRASAPPAASTASGPSSGRGARGRGPRGRSHDAGSVSRSVSCLYRERREADMHPFCDRLRLQLTYSQDKGRSRPAHLHRLRLHWHPRRLSPSSEVCAQSSERVQSNTWR